MATPDRPPSSGDEAKVPPPKRLRLWVAGLSLWAKITGLVVGAAALVSAIGTLTGAVHWVRAEISPSPPVAVVGTVGAPTVFPESHKRLTLAAFSVGKARVRIRDSLSLHRCPPSYGYLLPRRSIRGVPSPPTPLPSDAWAPFIDKLKGVDAGAQQVTLRIQGASSTPVEIHDLRVRIVRRALGRPGVVVGLYNGGCGYVPFSG